MDFLLEGIKSNLGEDAEFFYDIHCPDPYNDRIDYSFPVVVLNHSGLYLFSVIKDAAQKIKSLQNEVEYACRVFKSYFFTKIPIKTVFIFQNGKDFKLNQRFYVYDFEYQEIVTDDFQDMDSVLSFVSKNISDSEIYLNESEHDELVLKFTKESSEPIESDLVDKNYFVKKRGEWVPTFKKDSEKVFKFALFGGWFGLHRFYLGLIGSGLVYLLTFGLFGVGWFFDCLEIFLGYWKKKGKYLMPLKNKKHHAVEMSLLFVCLIGVSVLFFSFFN